MSNVIHDYLAYKQGTECPPNFYRWSMISAIATMLERRVWLTHTKPIYPNMYILLVGHPATRKSAAQQGVVNLMRGAGYDRFAPNKCSKQQFVSMLASTTDGDMGSWDSVDAAYIATDEFLDFLGIGNNEFTVCLAHLYDNHPEYKEEYKRTKVLATNPTVNILSCATPTNLQLGLPQEAGGTGFLSRAIMVYSEPTNLRITWPPPPDAEIEADIIERLQAVKQLQGEMQLTAAARKLMDSIYQNFEYLNDSRLAYYNGRRLLHLMKLCLVIAASYSSMVIHEQHVLEANTILVYTEEQMHKAFGEFGNSKFSKVNGKILAYMEGINRPVNVLEIHKAVTGELDHMQDLYKILDNLVKSDRIQASGAGTFILKKRSTQNKRAYTDFKSYLYEAEDYDAALKQQTELQATIANALASDSGSSASTAKANAT